MMTISRPLGLLDSIALAKDVKTRLEALEDYDLSAVIERLKRKQLLPEHMIDDAVYEFRRMMALCAIGHRGVSVPCEAVDEVWHTFILFTKEYAEFCHRIVGSFIHHSPPESRLPSNASGEDFLGLYTRYFGGDLDSDVQRMYVSAKPSHCHSDIRCHDDV